MLLKKSAIVTGFTTKPDRDVQPLRIAGRDYVLVPHRVFERMQAQVEASAREELPALPPLDADGTYPAVEYARASLARKIIRARWTAGLSQAELARRAGIRPETLNRIERGKVTPDTATIAKIDRILKKTALEPAD